MIAAEGSVTLTMARPIADRDVDFATLSEEEQAARYRRAGVIKVSSPFVTSALRPCQKGLLRTYALYEVVHMPCTRAGVRKDAALHFLGPEVRCFSSKLYVSKV
jgi:hypothetical protein